MPRRSTTTRRPHAFAVTLATGLATGLVTAIVAAAPSAPSLAQAPVPVLTATFSPATIGPGSSAALNLTIDNSGDVVAATDVSFVGVLPAEVTVATPANVVNGCGGVVDLGPAGEVSLRAGEVAAGAVCTISLAVTSATVGTHTIETSELSSGAGTAPAAAAALVVTADLPGFSAAFSPSVVPLGGRAALTYTFDNTHNALSVTKLVFDDVLPTGLVVADPSGAATDCGPAALPASFSPISAVPGTDRIEFAAFGFLSGGNEVVSAGSTCTVTVDVVLSDTGDAVDVIADVVGDGAARLENGTGPLSVAVEDGRAGPGGAAGAALDVVAAPLHATVQFVDDPVLAGTAATLRFTIANFDAGTALSDVALSDDLEAALPGLVAVDPLPVEPCGSGSVLTGGSQLALAGGQLAPDSSCAFDVTVAVPAGASSRATNTTGTVTASVVDATLPDATTAEPTTDETPTDETPADDTPTGETPDGEVGPEIPAEPVVVTGNVAADDLFVVLAPQLAKEFVDDPTGAGGVVTVAYTITNPDPDNPVTGVGFVDGLAPVLPAASVVGGTPAPPPPGSVAVNNVCGAGSQLSFLPAVGGSPATLHLAGGAIGAGGACSFTAVLDVAPSAASGRHASPTSAVDATLLGVDVAGAAAADELLVVGAPPVRMLFLGDPVTPGGTAAVLYTVVNGGEGAEGYDSIGPVADISFTHDLGTVAGMTAVAPLPTEPCGPGSVLTASDDGASLTLSGGSLAVDQSCTFAVTLQVAPTASEGRFLSASGAVVANASGVEVAGPGASDDIVVAPAQRIDLAVGITSGDDPVDRGGDVSYTVTVVNDGTIAAPDVVADIALPTTADGAPSVTLRSTAGCSNDPFTLSCALGEIPAGASASFTVSVVVGPDAADRITTTASVRTSGADDDGSNDTAAAESIVSAERVVAATPTLRVLAQV